MNWEECNEKIAPAIQRFRDITNSFHDMKPGSVTTKQAFQITFDGAVAAAEIVKVLAEAGRYIGEEHPEHGLIIAKLVINGCCRPVEQMVNELITGQRV